MNPPHGRKEIVALFGNPANPDGTPNAAWEEQNIRLVAPPAGWRLYYQGDGSPVPSTGIQLHRLLEESFHTALAGIWGHARTQLGGDPPDDAVRAWLHQRRLDVHGGGFNFRQITAGKSLSLHAFGIAIDWEPSHNPRQRPLAGTLPDWWYGIWNQLGWSDGRHFSTPDPMHVQYATGA